MDDVDIAFTVFVVLFFLFLAFYRQVWACFSSCFRKVMRLTVADPGEDCRTRGSLVTPGVVASNKALLVTKKIPSSATSLRDNGNGGVIFPIVLDLSVIDECMGSSRDCDVTYRLSSFDFEPSLGKVVNRSASNDDGKSAESTQRSSQDTPNFMQDDDPDDLA